MSPEKSPWSGGAFNFFVVIHHPQCPFFYWFSNSRLISVTDNPTKRARSCIMHVWFSTSLGVCNIQRKRKNKQTITYILQPNYLYRCKISRYGRSMCNALECLLYNGYETKIRTHVRQPAIIYAVFSVPCWITFWQSFVRFPYVARWEKLSPAFHICNAAEIKAYELLLPSTRIHL